MSDNVSQADKTKPPTANNRDGFNLLAVLQTGGTGSETSVSANDARLNYEWQALINHVHQENKPTSGELQQEESLLQRMENHATSDGDMQQTFSASLQEFHERALTQHLSNREVSNFYEQEGKLLKTHSWLVNDRDRIMAATEVMLQAAEPVLTAQGHHGTCTMAALEHKLYVQNPSIAAAMVASLDLTGTWTGKDGKTTSVDRESLQPKKEEQNFLPYDGDRSYASQVFQVGAMNDMSQHMSPGWRYLQRDEDWRGRLFDFFNASGEYMVGPSGEVVDYREAHPDFFDASGGPTGWATAEELTRLTGETHGLIQGAKWKYESIPPKEAPPKGIDNGDMVYVSSAQDFENHIHELKTAGRLPVLLAVASRGLVAIRHGTTPMPGNEPSHVICIDDYEPAQDGKDARVLIHNNWTQKYNGWTTVDRFFNVLS